MSLRMALVHEPLRIARDELIVVPETDLASIPAFVDRFRNTTNPVPIDYLDCLRKLVSAMIFRADFILANGWPALTPLYFHACRINDMPGQERAVWEEALFFIHLDLRAPGWSRTTVTEVEWQNVEDEGTERCERSLVISMLR
ncbi:MAG: hypothetical protein AAB608_00390 [Patescibacteria group bacterium]